MSRRPSASKQYNNSLSSMVDAIGKGTGGSQLSSYSTLAWANNYSLMTLNHMMLSYLYTGNGLFQTAIQVPVQDAISKGIIIKSGEMDQDDIDLVYREFEALDLWTTILNYFTWVRLYGGGAVIINTAGDPSKPLRDSELLGDVEFYDVDRWQLTLQQNSLWGLSSLADEPESELYYLNGQPIHRSRVLKTSGKKAPARLRPVLAGWGMSEGERMIRDLNMHVKTQEVLFEILDEAKTDIYRIAGFAQKLATQQGTDAITRRVQLANELKNYLSALVMDKDDEFDQKQMNFAGLAEVSNENRINIAASLRIPMVKLFGLSPSGFSTGDADLENYNQMVESEIRSKLNYPVRRMIEIIMLRLFNRVPEFTFEWPPLKPMTEKEMVDIETAKTANILAIYSQGLLQGSEAVEELEKAGVITVETAVSRGMEPINPEPEQEPKQFNNSIKVYRR
jgi:uncharacterized protein